MFLLLSDSDGEMESRVKEAAVSIKDLLPSLTLPSNSTPWPKETPSSDKKQEKNKVEEESRIIWTKKKQNDEERVDPAGPAPDQSNGERRSSEQEHVKVKRKKKKKQKENSEEETLSWIFITNLYSFRAFVSVFHAVLK